MTTLREAAQQALEALENTSPLGFNMESDNKFFAAITALRAALAEPVQEPVAWMYVNSDGECEQIEHETPPDDPSVTPLYTAPPQRKPLPASEIVTMYDESPRGDSDMITFARAIERAHGIGETK